MNLDYSLHGADDLEIRLQAAPAHLRQQIIDTLRLANLSAFKVMKEEIPQSGEGSSFRTGVRFKRYKSQDEPRAIDALRMGPIVYVPGGAGGGGTYETHVGMGADAPEHVRFFMDGTRDLGNFSGGEGNLGPLMRIRGRTGDRWGHRRRGQIPQLGWWVRGIAAAEFAITRRLQIIDVMENKRLEQLEG